MKTEQIMALADAYAANAAETQTDSLSFDNGVSYLALQVAVEALVHERDEFKTRMQRLMTTEQIMALLADLRSRINPAYAAQFGTESYERRLCAEAIESLVQERDVYKAQIEKDTVESDLHALMRQAIEQAGSVEPVAFIRTKIGSDHSFRLHRVVTLEDFDGNKEQFLKFGTSFDELTPLYLDPPTAPAQQPLTEEQIDFAWFKAMKSTPGTALPINEFARAIEAAHGIKGAAL